MKKHDQEDKLFKPSLTLSSNLDSLSAREVPFINAGVFGNPACTEEEQFRFFLSLKILDGSMSREEAESVMRKALGETDTNPDDIDG